MGGWRFELQPRFCGRKSPYQGYCLPRNGDICPGNAGRLFDLFLAASCHSTPHVDHVLEAHGIRPSEEQLPLQTGISLEEWDILEVIYLANPAVAAASAICGKLQVLRSYINGNKRKSKQIKDDINKMKSFLPIEHPFLRNWQSIAWKMQLQVLSIGSVKVTL